MDDYDDDNEASSSLNSGAYIQNSESNQSIGMGSNFDWRRLTAGATMHYGNHRGTVNKKKV